MAEILKYLIPLGLSMIPISELRGGIPTAILGYDYPWYVAYILCCLANLLPIPFILLFMAKILEWLRNSKVNAFKKFAGWLDRKVDKNTDKIYKYGFFGLMIFVAIPLPMTGAWTGALVAGVTKMKFWRAMLSVTLGVLIAGAVVTTVVLLGESSVGWLYSLFVKQI